MCHSDPGRLEFPCRSPGFHFDAEKKAMCVELEATRKLVGGISPWLGDAKNVRDNNREQCWSNCRMAKPNLL